MEIIITKPQFELIFEQESKNMTDYEPCGRAGSSQIHNEDRIFLKKFYEKEGFLPKPKELERIGSSKRVGDFYPQHPMSHLGIKSFYLCKSKVYSQLKSEVEKELDISSDSGKRGGQKTYMTNDGKYQLRSIFEVIFYNIFDYYGKSNQLKVDSREFFGKCNQLNKEVDFIYDNNTVIEIAGMTSEEYHNKINSAMECIKSLGYRTIVYRTRELEKSKKYFDFYKKVCQDFNFPISSEIQNDPFILISHTAMTKQKMIDFINDNIFTLNQVRNRNEYERMSKYIKQLYNMSVREYRKKLISTR